MPDVSAATWVVLKPWFHDFERDRGKGNELTVLGSGGVTKLRDKKGTIFREKCLSR